MPDSVHNEVKSIFDYLDAHHGFTLIRDWYKQDIDSLLKIDDADERHWRWVDEAGAYMSSMGLKDTYLYESSANENIYFSREGIENGAIDIQGFDYLFALDAWNNEDSEFSAGGVTCTIVHPKVSTDQLLFLIDNDTLVFQTDALARKLISKYGNNDEDSVPPRRCLCSPPAVNGKPGWTSIDCICMFIRTPLS